MDQYLKIFEKFLALKNVRIFFVAPNIKWGWLILLFQKPEVEQMRRPFQNKGPGRFILYTAL